MELIAPTPKRFRPRSWRASSYFRDIDKIRCKGGRASKTMRNRWRLTEMRLLSLAALPVSTLANQRTYFKIFVFDWRRIIASQSLSLGNGDVLRAAVLL
jgi:hypothetical protein